VSEHIFGSGKFIYELISDWPKWPKDWDVTCCTGGATDSANRVYVLNRSEHPIGVFEADGTFLFSFGEGLFGRAHGVFVDDEDIIYCSDDVDHIVMKFNTKGELIETIGTRGVPSDSGSDPDSGWPGWIDTVTHAGPPFNRPTRMVKSPKGEFWASDGYANAAIHHWDAEGNLIKTFGGPGREPGHFRLPHGLDVDRLDRVWVADRENSRIQLFSNEGEFLREWPNRLRPAEVFAGKGDYVYIGEIDGRITVMDLDGNIVSEIGYPDSVIRAHSVWVDQVGDIYFATLSRGIGFYKLVLLQGMIDG
jgi:DNA-binding beta-propeller fold protein YncE